MPSDLVFERGLPVAVDSERLVLGSILLDDSRFVDLAGIVSAESFAIEKHRTIWRRISELHERGEHVDGVTLYHELVKYGEAESCDGMTYLTSLDDGLPRISNVESYARIVREKALLREAIFTSQKIIDRCLLGQDDAAEIVSGASAQFLEMGVASANGDGLCTFAQMIEQRGGLQSLLAPDQSLGLNTGFTRLDQMTGGLRPGDLFILAARPSMGKTGAALGIVSHVATRKEPGTVAVFSLEMTRESLFERMVCASARIDLQKYRSNFLNREERARVMSAATVLAQAPIHIDDKSTPTLGSIHAAARKLKSRHGLALMIVDYLQLMEGKGENRNQQVSGLSRGFKLMAKDLGVPMIVLSQLSRASEQRGGDRRPMLSDLRDSGAIEQDADLVGFIHRPEVYHPERQDLRGQAELILAKQRQGPTGMVKLTFIRHCAKFENQCQDLDEQPGDTPWLQEGDD